MQNFRKKIGFAHLYFFSPSNPQLFDFWGENWPQTNWLCLTIPHGNTHTHSNTHTHTLSLFLSLSVFFTINISHLSILSLSLSLYLFFSLILSLFLTYVSLFSLFSLSLSFFISHLLRAWYEADMMMSLLEVIKLLLQKWYMTWYEHTSSRLSLNRKNWEKSDFRNLGAFLRRSWSAC